MVKSLSKLATEACVKNIRRIDDVGDAPYHVVRPVLMKIENPEQLREIEEASPQICGADEEVWRNFIKRDVPRGVLQRRNIEPKDPKNWWKVYKKLKRDAEEDRRMQDEQLKAVLNQKNAEKQENKMTYIDKVVDPRKNKAYAPRPTIFSRRPEQSSLSFGSGSRTSTHTGKGMLLKAKREARENSLFSARRNVLSTPTHLLGQRPGQAPLRRPVSSTTTGPNGRVNQPSSTSSPSARPQLTSAAAAPPPPPPKLKRPASSMFITNKKPRT